MKLKLLGSCMLIFASGKAGFAIARSMCERVALIARLQSLLQFMITEIDFALTFFPDALTKVGPALGAEIDSFCQQVVEGLEAGVPLSAAWEEALIQLTSNSPLYADDIKPLLSLAPIIGLTSRQDQLRHIKLAQEHLRQTQLQVEHEVNKNKKIWRYLGILSGLVVVLILI